MEKFTIYKHYFEEYEKDVFHFYDGQLIQEFDTRRDAQKFVNNSTKKNKKKKVNQQKG